MPATIQDWFTDFVNGPDFVAAHPYYAAVLARMQAVHDPGVPVMGVSAHGRGVWLHVNTDFFLKPGNQKYIHGVLLHEVHHVVLGHLGDPLYADAAHPDLMELAMELSANEYITHPLPGKPYVWTAYKHCGIAAGQSTAERYDLLVKARQAGRPVPVPTQWVDAHLPRGVGRCRPGAARPDPGAYVRVKNLVSNAVAAVKRGRAAGGHGGPGGSLAGRDPGHFLEELDAEYAAPPRPRLDWKTALRLFATPHRRPFATYARPNRRFPHRLGEVPGRLRRTDEGRPKRLLVAVDTSGSMTTDELHAIAGELRRLGRLAKFLVAECDAKVHRTYEYAGALPDVAGRGGTDFRPVFEPAYLAEWRPDGVVYFTDGEGPYPDDPPGLPTLWVLTKDWLFPCPWGQQAVMRRRA